MENISQEHATKIYYEAGHRLRSCTSHRSRGLPLIQEMIRMEVNIDLRSSSWRQHVMWKSQGDVGLVMTRSRNFVMGRCH